MNVEPEPADGSTDGPPIAAKPEVVFAFLADLENWPRWQSDMQSTTLEEGTPGEVGATYRYRSKAMGRTFDSTVRLVTVDAPREVAFEGEWTGMIRPSGRYFVEPTADGARVTLNPHPEAKGFGSLMAPVISRMIERLNREHLEQLRTLLEQA